MLRTAKLIIVLLLLASLQGCFTTILWGGDIQSERDEVTGERETKPHFELSDEHEGFPSLGVIGYRILLTPIALVLDCVTYPVQAFLFGWGGGDKSKLKPATHSSE